MYKGWVDDHYNDGRDWWLDAVATLTDKSGPVELEDLLEQAGNVFEKTELQVQYSIHCTHHTLIHHTPYTIHHTPYTIHHTPYTIHHTPYTTHHTPY
jgi:hypothetical protein